MKGTLGLLGLWALAGCGAREDHSIVCYGRENSSGSYTYFKEHVLGGDDYAPGVEALPGTAAVVSAVMQDPRAIGYGGIAYLSGVRALAIQKDGTAPGVEPTLETVQKGRYPLSRPLYFYTLGPPEGLVKSFIDWTQTPEGLKICAHSGYFPVPSAKAAPPPEDPPPGNHALAIVGSDTMNILTARWAERYMQLHPSCALKSFGGGSETGIRALREGEVEICQASRPLKPAEMDEIAAKRGKRPVEFAVALDGLAVFVNEKNPVREITLSDLRGIFTGKIRRWGQLHRPSP